MKKVLSLVLVLALVLGSFSFAFAFDDVADLDCEDAVDTLVALGVINGYNDGTFRPENTVTRAQIAKMLVVALGYEDLISGTTSSFTDCAGHWADSYIAFAAGQKIVNGYPDGTFKPEAVVSYDEAITMIVRALGYTDDCLAGTWPTNYKIKALDLGITDDVKLSTGGADRGGVAMLIYNALEAEIVTINADDEVVYADKAEDVVTMLDRLGDKTPLYVTPEMIDEDDDDYQVSEIDLLQYMYEDLEVYIVENEDGDDAVVYVSDRTVKNGTDVITGTIDSMTGTDITIEDADEDLYTYDASGTSIFVNGADAVDTKLADIKTAVDKGVTVTIKAVFTTDKDSEITESHKVVSNAEATLVTFATDVVQIDDEYDDDDLDIDGIKLPVTEDNDDEEIVDLENLTITGDATSLEDIQEDDIVVVYAADVKEDYPQVVKLAVSRQTLEGKVTKKYDDDTFTVAGEKVNTTEYAKITTIEDAIELGQEGIFYLDDNGEIVVFDGTSELDNYAVIVGVKNGDLDTDFDETEIDDFAQIKLATFEGETIVYDVYSEYDDDATTDKLVSFDLRDAEGDATSLSGSAIIKLNDEISKDTLVKYDLNSDGQIDELQIVATTKRNYEVSGTKLGTAYRFTSDTVIFDADDDYAVVELADLVEDKVLNNVLFVEADGSSFGNLDVVIVPKGGVSSTEDGTYAVILDIDQTIEDDDEIQELSLLVDGEEGTYKTDDDNVAKEAQVDDSYFNVVELTLDGDVVTEVENVDATTSVAIIGDAPNGAEALTVSAIDSDLIKIGDTLYGISDDVVVYVANYDTDAWDDVEVGDLGDIDEEDYVKAYNVDADDDDDQGLDIIFVFTGDIDDL